jgi:23S rRNA (adenine2503-C2)-methyltransferase
MPRVARPDGRLDIKSLTLAELEADFAERGWPRFRARQVYKWLWQKGARDFAAMSNISKEGRGALEAAFHLAWLEEVAIQTSSDGTQKFLWRCADGSRIESVLIPDDERLTLCVSTQVGCAMACTFCLTGDLGLKRHLHPAEIANQPLQVRAQLPEGRRITNIVMMGMGEPLHNYDNLVAALRTLLDDEAMGFSHRRITVSTVGLIPQMQRLTEELPVNLAVSLNATTEASRREVMPITRKYSMAELLEACRKLPIMSHKRITFEYVMMAGFNDGMDDCRRLAGLMRGIRSKVNLIPYNENPDRDIRRPSEAVVKSWQDYLVNHGVQCSIRTTRGRDISAACGQLGKAGEGTGAPHADADRG